MDKAQYLDLFIEESQENLRCLTHNLHVLRDNPKNREILKEAVRQAHTIKGTAAMMSFAQIAEVASHMENSLQELGQDQVEADVKMINALCQNLDTLKVLLEDIVKEKESSA